MPAPSLSPGNLVTITGAEQFGDKEEEYKQLIRDAVDTMVSNAKSLLQQIEGLTDEDVPGLTAYRRYLLYIIDHAAAMNITLSTGSHPGRAGLQAMPTEGSQASCTLYMLYCFNATNSNGTPFNHPTGVPEFLPQSGHMGLSDSHISNRFPIQENVGTPIRTKPYTESQFAGLLANELIHLAGGDNDLTGVSSSTVGYYFGGGDGVMLLNESFSKQTWTSASGRSFVFYSIMTGCFIPSKITP